MSVIEDVKKIPVEDVIALNFVLSGTGRYRKGVLHDSLVIDTQKQIYNWYSKAEYGDVIAWVRRNTEHTSFGGAINYLKSLLASMPNRVGDNEVVAPVVKELSQDAAYEYYANLLTTPLARDWWNKRGVNEASCALWKLGYKPNHFIETEQGKVSAGATSSIPFFEDGVVKAIRHRLWKPLGKTRYVPEQNGLGSWLFNSDILEQSHPSIVIIEGEIKYIVCHQWGERGVGLSGVGILPDRYKEKIANFNTVYVCVDPDPKGSPYDKAWIIELAKMTDVRIITLPDKVDDYINAGNWKGYKGAKQNARRFKG